MNIELPILYNSQEQSQLKELGVETSIREVKSRSMTFFTISCIAPYFEEDKIYCCIHSNGQEFICPFPYKEVKLKINNHEKNDST